MAVVQANRPPAANATKARKNRTPIYSSPNRPLSDYSDDLNWRAAKRTEEWVNRPAEVRLRETQQRGGYVVRPLNSFMLYRLAYITEATARYSQSKQQNLPAIVGESWRKEHPEVREKYKAYARTESRNHHKAYPKYRYSPKRLGMEKPYKEDTSPEEELRTISGDGYSCDSCWFTAARSSPEEELRKISGDECSYDSCWFTTTRSKNQSWDTTLCYINTDASMRSPAPSQFAAWQPILLPMQQTLWPDQYGNHAVHYQVVGSNHLWPSAMTPSLFLGPDNATRELPMGSIGFTTMSNTNSLPIADSSWSGAEMQAGVGINYAMPAYEPSYCGYPYTSSSTAALQGCEARAYPHIDTRHGQ
jgi:hypothetical protein